VKEKTLLLLKWDVVGRTTLFEYHKGVNTLKLTNRYTHIPGLCPCHPVRNHFRKALYSLTSIEL
jgi:hypothetical protein